VFGRAGEERIKSDKRVARRALETQRCAASSPDADLKSSERGLVRAAQGAVRKAAILEEEAAHGLLRKFPWTARCAWEKWPSRCIDAADILGA